MGLLYKRLTKYLLYLYFKKYTSKQPDNKDIDYLNGLLDILRKTEFDQKIIGFNSQVNYVLATESNIEELLLTLIQVTSALNSGSSIYRGLVQKNKEIIALKNFITNRNNEQLVIEKAIAGLTDQLTTFIEAFKKAQGGENQVNKTNVFILIQYIDSLCIMVENILTIQLNSN